MPEAQLSLALDPAAEADRQIGEVLAGGGLYPWPLPEEARKILEELRWHKGSYNPVTIASLSQRLGFSDREIKEHVRSLIVDFGIRIVGARGKHAGYYIAISAADVEAACRTLEREIVALARRVRALRGAQYLNELLGQVPLKLDKGDAA